MFIDFKDSSESSGNSSMLSNSDPDRACSSTSSSDESNVCSGRPSSFFNRMTNNLLNWSEQPSRYAFSSSRQHQDASQPLDLSSRKSTRVHKYHPFVMPPLKALERTSKTVIERMPKTVLERTPEKFLKFTPKMILERENSTTASFPDSSWCSSGDL